MPRELTRLVAANRIRANEGVVDVPPRQRA
jgi:hypothetical protein